MTESDGVSDRDEPSVDDRVPIVELGALGSATTRVRRRGLVAVCAIVAVGAIGVGVVAIVAADDDSPITVAEGDPDSESPAASDELTTTADAIPTTRLEGG